MPTNRTKRTRNRRGTVTTDLERFLIDGRVESDSDVCWQIFADPAGIFRAWEECKDRIQKQNNRVMAAIVFDGKGKRDRFDRFSWINRQGYQRWKEGKE